MASAVRHRSSNLGRDDSFQFLDSYRLDKLLTETAPHPGAQHHCIRIAHGEPVTGVPESNRNTEPGGVFSALGVKKPAASQALSLL